MKNRKAFTLVELLIAMALITVVGAIMVRLLWFPSQARVASEKEFHVQSSLRSGSQMVNTSVRDASAVYLLTKEPPQNLANDLTPKWDYLICEQKDGESVIVHYKWITKSDGSSGHVRNVIAQAKSEEVNFYINFETTDGGKLLKYEIVAKDVKTGREDKIETDLKPLNTFNVTDNSKIDPNTGKKVGNALAFRSDAIDPSLGGSSGYELVTVSLVLDISGSMRNDMDGWFVRTSSKQKASEPDRKFFVYTDNVNTTNKNWVKGYNKDYFNRPYGGDYYHLKNARKFDESRQRINILKRQVYNMIDRLNTSPNVDRIQVGLYPFSYLAYPAGGRDKYKFKVLKTASGSDQSGLIKNAVASMVADSATNVGDGIRWAYHDIIDVAKSNNTKRTKHFILVLTDGQPNYYTGIRGKNKFYYDKGYSSTAHQYVSSWDNGKLYMDVMGKHVKHFPKDYFDKKISGISDFAEPVDATVIGFSNSASDNAACNGLGIEIGAQKGKDGQYFITAGSEADLAAAFKKFSEKVLDKASLWYVVAPE